ncbi:MAG: molybdopterin-dependent oxidoreductase, partial [Actinomycetota bacterium]|nr:molybdopterin-dependent oxidoreductase [Actinomycetota bacterium]
IVAGRSNLAESEGVASASINAVLAACPGAKVLPVLRRGNVFGAVRMGLTPQDGGLDGLGILQAAAGGKLECLVLLGVDPIGDCPDGDLARQALAGARRLIAVDTHLTDSSKLAQVVLAVSAYGEKAGTTTNIEGRVQTVAQKVTATGTTRPDWMIAAELMSRFGVDEAIEHLETVDDVTEEIAASVPGFAGVTIGALRATADGLVAGTTGSATELPLRTTSTAESRISYDYRLVVSRKLYDQAVGTSRSPSLAALAPGSAAHVHPLDLDRIGVKSGTEIRVVGARSTVVLPVVPNEAVARGTVWVPFNQPGSNIADAIDAQAGVADVRLERL